MQKSIVAISVCALAAAVFAAAEPASVKNHTFTLGDADFLLDGKPFVMHCGEIHYARIPRPYWRHRLQMLRAMGCNAVGCYMFWNYHEREPGKFKWDGMADAAAFCRMAQEEGLWVMLRPGPYACAEWEGGGAPWWLMREEGKGKPISMRSSDPRWLEPAKRWITEVGRVLAPLQVTRGGPILMVQVENEYGLHGNDVNYMRALRQATIDAGFEVPLYACNPPRVTQNGFIPELFQAANFGGDPEQRFGVIRQFQPKGPLMCSEYYPAWFDTWGQAHHYAKSDREFFGPIDWMLEHGASFSLYMAHGGTSFGGWVGCRNPFVPNVTSYDFEAPINEHGAPNPSFAKFRDRMAKFLNPGETIREMPQPIPVKDYGRVALRRTASVDALCTREVKVKSPVFMERLGQGFGLVSYETSVPAEIGGDIRFGDIHDFGYVFLDGKRLGTLDRRHRGLKVHVPRGKDGMSRKLQIVVEAMGRINSSSGMEDRKGLNGPIRLDRTSLTGWIARMMPIDPDGEDISTRAVVGGAFSGRAVVGGAFSGDADAPALYSGELEVTDEVPADTFLDMSSWRKGIAWVNGRNLGRFWCIGPQQTLYVPGCWLRKGKNSVVVLDFFGPGEKGGEVAFRAKPVLDVLRPELDFNSKKRPSAKMGGGELAASGSFPQGEAAQVVMFEKPMRGSVFTFVADSVYDKKNTASVAEFDFLDKEGNPITSLGLQVTGVDSEEEIREDGVAENAIDGQVEACWIAPNRSVPHWIEFTADKKTDIYGIRYTPRQGRDVGRIRDWKFFVR